MKSINLNRGIPIHVLEIMTGSPGALRAKCSVFRKHGDQVDLEEELAEQPLEEMIIGLPKHAALILYLSGNQVLSRYSSSPAETLFPEIEAQDFAINKRSSSNGWILEAACRQSLLEDLIEQAIPDRVFVLDVALGPVPTLMLENQLEDMDLHAGHFIFQFRNSSLAQVSENELPANTTESDSAVTLGGTTYNSRTLIHLGVLLQHLEHPHEVLPKLKSRQVQWKYHRRFRIWGIAALSGIFVLLLVNFLLFSQAQAKLREMQKQGSHSMELVRLIDQTLLEIGEYRSLDLGHALGPEETFSFYLEEMAGSRPSGLWFDKLQVHPISKRMEKDKAVETHTSEILLSGSTSNPVHLNKLIAALEEKPWLSDVELISYENKPETGSAQFKLRLVKK